MKWVVAAALLALAACAPAPPVSTVCSAPLKPAVEVDLYFGREMPGREVSEEDWAAFLNQEVTPRFPAGLSVIDARGQYRNASGRIERERSKLLVIVVFDAPAHRPKVQAIVDSYGRRFAQESVLQVERPVCAGV